MDKLKKKLRLSPDLISDYDDTNNTLYKNHDSAQCKLLVYQLNQLINVDDYEKCYDVSEKKIIGEGAFGTIYKNDDDTIYKISKTFNKLLDYMEDCDVFNEKLINLLIIILEIPKTNNKIQKIIEKSEIANHFNIPTEIKLCSYFQNTNALNIDGIKKLIPVYSYIIPYIKGIDLYKLLNVEILTFYDLLGIFIQLIYITSFLNLHGIYHNDIHRKNIFISKNTETIHLEGLTIGDNEIQFTFECKYFVSFIDFELTIVTNNIVVPIDVLQSIIMFKNDSRTYKILTTNEDFYKIFDFASQIYDEYKEEGYRIYEINKLNKLPLAEDKLVYLTNIFNTLTKILTEQTQTDVAEEKYKIKYLKYKHKYLQEKKIIFLPHKNEKNL